MLVPSPIEFKPKKGGFFALLYLGVPAGYFLCCIYIIALLLNDKVSNLIFCLILGILILSSILFIYPAYIWIKARYYIDGKIFKYNFGIFKGQIEISKITSIKRSTYPSSSTHITSLNPSGFIIYHSVSEDVHIPREQLFISPLNEEKFLKYILAINANIHVN